VLRQQTAFEIYILIAGKNQRFFLEKISAQSKNFSKKIVFGFLGFSEN